MLKTKKDAFFNDYPELMPLAEELKKGLELAFMKTTGHFVDPAAYPLPENKESLEWLLAQRFQTLTETKKQMATNTFQAKRLNLDLEKNERYATFLQKDILANLHKPISVFNPGSLMEQVKIAKVASPKVGYFQTQSGTIALNDYLPPYDKITLQVHSITCADETNIESDSDHIALSCLFAQVDVPFEILPDNSIKFDQGYYRDERSPIYEIGQNIGDGFVWYPTPYPWNIHTYDIWSPFKHLKVVKTVICTFTLAELDNGGFNDFIEKIFKAIASGIAAGIAHYAGTIIYNLAIKYIGEILANVVGGILGGAIGALALYLLVEFVDMLVEWWKDDVFPIATINQTIPAGDQFLTPFLEHGLATDLKYVSFEGFGGLYELAYSWQLLHSTNMGPSFTDSPARPETPHGVSIFTDVYFAGDSIFLKEGTYSLKGNIRQHPLIGAGSSLKAGTFDLNIDSIKLDEGFVVFAFKSADCTGDFIMYDKDMPYLSDDWRDQISSVVVTRLNGLK